MRNKSYFYIFFWFQASPWRINTSYDHFFLHFLEIINIYGNIKRIVPHNVDRKYIDSLLLFYYGYYSKIKNERCYNDSFRDNLCYNLSSVWKIFKNVFVTRLKVEHRHCKLSNWVKCRNEMSWINDQFRRHNFFSML